MIKTEIAGVKIAIHNRYPLMREYFEGFLLPETADTDFEVTVSDRELEEELGRSEGMLEPDEAELVCAYRAAALRMPAYDAMLLHAVILDFQGIGVALIAPSGTGKTTLALHILEAFDGRVRIISGDKPVVRLLGDKLCAFGTPFNGKEGYGCGGHTELRKLCFLKQDQINFIERTDEAETTKGLLSQTVIPREEKSIEQLFSLLEKILTMTEGYRLSCKDDISAAVMATGGMGLC